MAPTSFDERELDESFVGALELLRDVPFGTRPPLPAIADIFEAQVWSRHIDFALLELRKMGRSFYTIGSSGHEGNAVVAEALRVSDPALLHYRSAGFYLRRAAKAGYAHGPRDILLGAVAATNEPMAGGRHKVFGNAELSILPQTSTIASHLPRALGMAASLRRATRLALPGAPPKDSVIVCSFGDASINHSTAAGALNAAAYISYQGIDLPVLFVCEDNGIGISVKTAPGWVEQTLRSREQIAYFKANGCDAIATLEVAKQAVAYVRRHRRPAALHLEVVRLLAHAGSDVALVYRSPEELRSEWQRDPLVATARQCIEHGMLTAADIAARYEEVRVRVAELARAAAVAPQLASAAEIVAPLRIDTSDAIAVEAARCAADEARRQFWGKALPEEEPPLAMVGHLNRCLGDLLLKYPQTFVFGEDVARKGGVYGVTRGLAKRAGAERVFDTLLDEQTILGLALGAGVLRALPIPEIQYLAYLHNAIDQLRGEGASLPFFSQRQYLNPMVVRIAGLAYQKGFGGHFHNENAVGALREIPGIVIGVPSNGADAAAMLRTCVAAAHVDGALCVFLEPIALYHTKDLHEDHDGQYLSIYDPRSAVPLGRAHVYGEGQDVAIVTFGNGVFMARRAAKRLEAQHGVRCRVLDLRWLAPLPVDDVLRTAAATGRVLVVDETRRTGGVGEGVITALVEGGFTGPIRRVAGEDTYLPLGSAADHVLVSEADIEAAVLELTD